MLPFRQKSLHVLISIIVMKRKHRIPFSRKVASFAKKGVEICFHSTGKPFRNEYGFERLGARREGGKIEGTEIGSYGERENAMENASLDGFS
jgi:hypothetical protein